MPPALFEKVAPPSVAVPTTDCATVRMRTIV